MAPHSYPFSNHHCIPRPASQDRPQTTATQARSIAASHKYGLRLDILLRPSLLPALAVFAVAARHQNFAQAAQELHLTASAVSHHVRRLEEVLET
ncbi:LysR family transcriptional regulator, partial [Klebsiella pneumoniae]